MKPVRNVTFIFLLIAAGTQAEADMPFLGPIPVQYVTSDKELILDMHRFFQPAGTRLDLPVIKDVNVAVDTATLQLRVQAKRSGLIDIPIALKGAREARKTVLTLATGGRQGHGHRFTFKPPADNPVAQKVFLAGSFNGWSTDKTPLTGPNETGEYTVDLPLEPGKYSYKFVVDGKWTWDRQNPDTEDNGMGDRNSVITVAGAKQNPAPVIYADRLTDNALVVRAATAPALSAASTVLETDGGAEVLPAKINGNTIEVVVPVHRSGFVRVIATSAEGNPSNVVRCGVGEAGRQFSWHDAVLYYAFTDRFFDGDRTNDKPVDNPRVEWPANFHGGDLAGVRRKIEEGYFEKLGINTIWVAPLNRNPDKAYQEYPEPHRWYTGYHGYWPVSSTELDPHVGSAADLQKLVETAHAHNMKIIADLVLHHVHEEHPWWKQHRDWFGTLELPDGRKNLRLWNEQQFTTWFEPYLPSFDFAKDAPVKALIDNSVWWLNRYKLDGFRLDAVKHILPSFWWKFRAALRERVDRKGKSPLYLVGETFKDRNGIISFVGPNMLDGQFDFPLYDQIKDCFALTTGDMNAIDDALASSERTYGKETLMSPLIGNHDKGRFMAYADGELPAPGKLKEEEVGWKNPPRVQDPANYTKLELAQALLMAIDGVPMIYYGDEFGMTGAGDPDNRRDMRFGDQLTGDEKRVLDNFTKLAAIRRGHPALRHGSRRALRADNDVYAFVRAHLEDRVVVALNRGVTDANLDLDVAPELADGDYAEYITNTPVQVRGGKLGILVPARTAAFVAAKR